MNEADLSTDIEIERKYYLEMLNNIKDEKLSLDTALAIAFNRVVEIQES